MSQDPLTRLLEEELEKSEAEWRQRQEDESTQPWDDDYQYNPQIASKPGEALEVTVELPDNHTEQQMIEAMHEAARKAGLV